MSETGRFKLHGHTDSVTQMQFTQNNKFLISSSKDSQIRFWNLATHSCFYTLSGSTSEVYGFALIKSDRMLIVASAEVELVVHELTWLEDADINDQESSDDESNENVKKKKTEGLVGSELLDEENNQGNKVIKTRKRGTVFRQGSGRAIQITVSSDEKLVLVLSGNIVDAYRIYTDDEAKKRLNKKLRKAKKKVEGEKDEVAEDEPMITEADISKDVTLFITRIGDIGSDSKIKWITFAQNFHKTGETGCEYRVSSIFNVTIN